MAGRQLRPLLAGIVCAWAWLSQCALCDEYDDYLFDDDKVLKFESTIDEPLPDWLSGRCGRSRKSGRPMCFPVLAELDTSCVGDPLASPPDWGVRPPHIDYASQNQRYFVSGGATATGHGFEVAVYQCVNGYELLDEVDRMFCSNRQWVRTPPVCVPINPCWENKGNCSHFCHPGEGRSVLCSCPRHMRLLSDARTCADELPTAECQEVVGCVCEAVEHPHNGHASHGLLCSCNKERCIVRRGPPRLQITWRERVIGNGAPIVLKPGGHLSVTCSAIGYPYPDVQWYRNDSSMVQTHPVQNMAIQAQILGIKNLYRSSRFHCEARNTEGSTRRAIDVLIAGPGSSPRATLKKFPDDVGTVEMRWPPLQVINRPVQGYRIYYTSDLTRSRDQWHIVDIEQGDATSALVKDLQADTRYYFTMAGYDELGEGISTRIRSFATLKEIGPPQLSIEPGEVVRAQPLVPVSVTCRAAEPGARLSWLTDDGRTVARTKAAAAFITLTLNETVEDRRLVCRGVNRAGEAEVAVKLEIAGPGSPPRGVTSEIRNGLVVYLTWHPPDVPNGEITGYTVYYTDTPSSPLGDWRRLRVDGASLSAVVDDEHMRPHADYYIRVAAASERGEGVPSDIERITTMARPTPPVITLEPSGAVTLAALDRAKLVVDCTAVGVPRPSVDWVFRTAHPGDPQPTDKAYDRSDPMSEDTTRSHLYFNEMTQSGSVTCVAVNEAGVANATLAIRVLGPGAPPRQLTVDGVDGNVVALKWLPPLVQNDPVKGYTIWHRPLGPAAGEWQSANATGLSTALGGLAENAEYELRVAAFNEHGAGPMGPVVRVKTAYVETAAEIVSFALTRRSRDGHVPLEPRWSDGHNATVVTLRAGATITAHCAVAGYPKPKVTLHTDAEWPVAFERHAINGHSNATYLALSGTAKNVRHNVDFHCAGKNRIGAVNRTVGVRIPGPGSAPKDIHTTVFDNNTVLLRWQPPTYPNGEITGYVLHLSEQPKVDLKNDPKYSIPAGAGAPTEMLMVREWLQPGIRYYFRMTGETSDGHGPYSATQHFDMHSGAPLDPPQDISASVTPENHVQLAWRPPKHPNGNITHYMVYYSEDESLPTASGTSSPSMPTAQSRPSRPHWTSRTLSRLRPTTSGCRLSTSSPTGPCRRRTASSQAKERARPPSAWTTRRWSPWRPLTPATTSRARAPACPRPTSSGSR